MTKKTLSNLLQTYREGGVFPSYDQLAAIAGSGQAGAAVRGEAVAESATDQLYGAVMNIPCKTTYLDAVVKMAYKEGHRDARHAAADLIAAFSSSARAVDAPSEPSELKTYEDGRIDGERLGRAVIDIHNSQMAENCHYRERVFNEIIALDDAEGLSRFARVKSCAADALDRQPTVAAQQGSIADDAEYKRLSENLLRCVTNGARLTALNDLTGYVDSRASSAPVAPIAPAIDLNDTLSALLWLYRRLPRGYGHQAHIEKPIVALADHLCVGIFECMAERGSAPQQEGSEAGNG